MYLLKIARINLLKYFQVQYKCPGRTITQKICLHGLTANAAGKFGLNNGDQFSAEINVRGILEKMEYADNVILTWITKRNVIKESKQKKSNKNLKNNKDNGNKVLRLNPNMLYLKKKNNYYKELLKAKMTAFVSSKKN